MRVVLDTNTLVSVLLLKQSIPRQVFDQVFDNALKIAEILLSTATVTELNDVLKRDKFKKYITDAERALFAQTLITQGILIDVTQTITVCRDTKDNKFLELAMEGKADYIITGDQDLLILNPFNNIEIITPRDFLYIR